ncbi:MAG: hypothetical protein WCD49_01050 [Candidatus Acidiferrales bacterium]
MDDSQSREISHSITKSDPRSKAHRGGETGPHFRKLNRQIPELETPLSLRKQTTANYSNRQKNSFLATRRSPPATSISNRELLGLEILQVTENKSQRPLLIANFEPNHFVDFQAFVAAAFRRAGFPLLLEALGLAGRSGKSWQRSGCSK